MSYKLPNGLILMSEILLFEAIVVVTIRYAIRWCYWDTKRRSYKAPAELKSVYRIPELNIVPCNTAHSNASQIFFNKLYALRNATGEARSQEYVPISIAVLFLPFNAWFIVIGNEQYSVEHMKTCFPFNSLDLFMRFRCYSKKERTHWLIHAVVLGIYKWISYDHVRTILLVLHCSSTVWTFIKYVWNTIRWKQRSTLRRQIEINGRILQHKALASLQT